MAVLSNAGEQSALSRRSTGKSIVPPATGATIDQSVDLRRLIEVPQRPAPTDEAVIALMRQARKNRESKELNGAVVAELGRLQSDDVEWALVDLMRDTDQRTADAASQELLRRNPAKVRGPVLWALSRVQPRGWAKAIPEADRAAWAAIGLSTIDAPENGPPMEQRVGNGTMATVHGPDKGAKEVYASVSTKHPIVDMAGERITVTRHQVAVNRYDSQGRFEWGKITVVTPIGHVVTGHSEKPVTTQQAMQLLKLAAGLETKDFESVGTIYPVPSQEDQRFIRMAMGLISQGPDGKAVVDAWQTAHPELASATGPDASLGRAPRPMNPADLRKPYPNTPRLPVRTRPRQ
jgi:hypothetical protein